MIKTQFYCKHFLKSFNVHRRSKRSMLPYTSEYFRFKKRFNSTYHCSDAYDWGYDAFQESEFQVPFDAFVHGGAEPELVPSSHHAVWLSQDVAVYALH